MPVETSADVVVIGAGLAGLACAVTLHEAGVAVEVVEAEPEVGGRVRSQVVDGFTIDRGFQLLNPAYPAVRQLLDVAALRLQPFPAGVAVATGGRRLRLLDPRRAPQSVPASGRAVASLVTQDGPRVMAELGAFAAYAAAAGYEDPTRLKRRADVPAAQAFAEAGVRGPVLERLLRPFLAGVLGEGELTTSRRYVDLVLRSFARGTPAVPAGGMGEISRQLASRLPTDAVRLGTTADLDPNDVARHTSGRTRPAVVVDATNRGPSQTSRGWHALTTHWFAVDSRRSPRPAPDGILHVDGDGRGPVVNTAVQSLAAPSYAPPGYWLVQATVLGGRPAVEQARRHCELIYGASTEDWELLEVSAIEQALPVASPPLELRRPVRLGDSLFACGDSFDTPSTQGALVSGLRTAAAVLGALGHQAPKDPASPDQPESRQ